MATAAPEEGRKVVKVVFLALVMDLLAFTMPLPLFPRLIAWYLERETRQTSVAAAASGSLLSQLLSASHAWRSYLLSWSGASATLARASGKNWDVVLLGGAMGSLFSFCQCIISPWLGGLSDTYGRKPVLLVTMLGNIISAAIWLRSTTFSSYLLSRIVGGLSEGNVQLSTAIISDVTDSVSRPRSLALVGIAFSICFTLGPSIGAYFASRPLPLSNTTSWNVFAFPAAISLVLLVLETLYLLVKLPETRTWAKKGIVQAKEPKAKASVEDRLTRLKQLGRAHGMFLFFFSGDEEVVEAFRLGIPRTKEQAEFTLTFLTYDLFSYTNAQNGRLLSFIGILSASLQGRYVRPRMAKIGEVKMASTGIFSCVSALLLLALLPSVPPSMTTVTLYTAAACLAYTSATVVSCLTSAAAGQCDDDVGNEGDARLKRGVALGRYRSAGQLGRAIGPLLASSAYWLAGPQLAYSTLGICLLGVWIYVRGLAREVSRDAKTE